MKIKNPSFANPPKIINSPNLLDRSTLDQTGIAQFQQIKKIVKLVNNLSNLQYPSQETDNLLSNIINTFQEAEKFKNAPINLFSNNRIVHYNSILDDLESHFFCPGWTLDQHLHLNSLDTKNVFESHPLNRPIDDENIIEQFEKNFPWKEEEDKLTNYALVTDCPKKASFPIWPKNSIFSPNVFSLETIPPSDTKYLDYIKIGQISIQPDKKFITQYSDILYKQLKSFSADRSNLLQIYKSRFFARMKNLKMVQYGFYIEKNQMDPICYDVFYVLYFS